MKIKKFAHSIVSFYVMCPLVAYADNIISTFFPSTVVPYIGIGTLTTISLFLMTLLLYGCIKKISILQAMLLSCIANIITAGLLIPIFVATHMNWLHMPFKFVDAPILACGIWILLYLVSTCLAVTVIHILCHYLIKDLLIPLFVGNFIVFILTINTYVVLALYRFSTEANVFTKLLVSFFHSL